MNLRKIFLTLCIAAGYLCGGGPAAQAQTTAMDNNTFRQIFPQGEPLPAQFAQYFSGRAWLAPLTQNGALQVPVSNVTFEPGCRNNWHSHTGGQLLICTAGRGYYQEQGAPARELHPGDIVEIAPDVVHWHGAAPDSWFSHLAVECNPQTNVNTWLGPVDEAQYAAATTPSAAGLEASDPELAAVLDNFRSEAEQYGSLDRRTRLLVTEASCVAQLATEELRCVVDEALQCGVDPAEVKEVVYHAVPYVGRAKALACLRTVNEALTARGIVLPLAAQATVTPETRYEKGLAVQQAIFGPAIAGLYETAPENQKHIQRHLSANCFGDYQTRGVFDARQRELLTFALLISLGGCEPQVKAHITGNANVGNDKAALLAVATQLLPWNGYPRTLNAIACLNEVFPEK